MRIVAVSDTHTFEEDLGEIPWGDVFVHAGDMLRGGELEALERVAAWIRALPHRHKIIVAGNHDACFQDARAEACALLGDAIYLEDSGVTLDGVTFWGSPWQPEYHDWAFNLPRGPKLAEKWAKIPVGTEILVTHCPPLGHGDLSSVEGRHGCEELIARVRAVKPRLHLFGHIHEAGGLTREGETTFVNVTTWECERGPTVLDWEAGRVTPVRVPRPRR